MRQIRPALAVLASLVLVLLLLVSAPNAARAGTPGEVGIFFDAAGTQRGPLGYLVAGEPFDVYVVGFDLRNDVLGFEFSLDIPDGLLLLGYELNPATAINPSPHPNSFLVGTGECLPATGPDWLVKLQLLYLDPVLEYELCLRAYFPPTEGLERNGGWLDCYYNLHPFEFVGTECLLIFDPCPPRIFDWRFDMDDADAAPTTTALVPLEIWIDSHPKCIGPVNVPWIVEFTLDFNPTVATFVEMLSVLGPGTWGIAATELEPGSVRIRAESISPHTNEELVWFELRFTMGDDEGSTLLTLKDIAATDRTGRGVNLAPDTAILSSRTVSNHGLSIGALKARY